MIKLGHHENTKRLKSSISIVSGNLNLIKIPFCDYKTRKRVGVLRNTAICFESKIGIIYKS